MGIVCLIAYLFYRSMLAVPLLVPLFVWYLYQWELTCMKKKERAFQIQFKEALQALSSSLNVGYSMENAVKEARRDLSLLYSPNERIMRELSLIVHQLNMNVTAEQAFTEFANRVSQEDAVNFATVVVTAKRSGGDLLMILRSSITQICDKIEVQKEIQTLIAAKRMEFLVMSAIPFGILFYMRFSFPEFMGVLYGTVLGVCLMTGCLIIYLGAFYLGRKIIEIEV